MVGAVADWFAVTALFRYPLGIRIPHTAIIPNRKERIGSSLGRFVENNFLSPPVIVARLRTTNIARKLAEWLANPEHGDTVGKHVAAGVGGLVQVPCIERCAYGAVKAWTGFLIARNEIPAHRRVDFDTTVDAMALTAKDQEEAALRQQFQAGAPEIDRMEALRNLALRTGLKDIRGLVSLINHSMRFGTSIAIAGDAVIVGVQATG